MNQRIPHREALRTLLSDGAWHHMAEVQKAGGWRYGARLFELKTREGYVFEKRMVGDDVWEYRHVVEGQMSFA